MSGLHRAIVVVVSGAVLLSAAPAPLQGAIAGPAGLPLQLPGLWRISLCVSRGHAWIRFQHVETGEVHTLARYAGGFGGELDWRTLRSTWPRARCCGVVWDHDLKYDLGVRTDGCALRCGYVWHPRIYRGRANGHGHCVVRMNCATFARDAWHFYTGEWYDLPLIATPSALQRSVCQR
jgi:hypothetical protein